MILWIATELLIGTSSLPLIVTIMSPQVLLEGCQVCCGDRADSRSAVEAAEAAAVLVMLRSSTTVLLDQDEGTSLSADKRREMQTLPKRREICLCEQRPNQETLNGSPTLVWQRISDAV